MDSQFYFGAASGMDSVVDSKLDPGIIWVDSGFDSGGTLKWTLEWTLKSKMLIFRMFYVQFL